MKAEGTKLGSTESLAEMGWGYFWRDMRTFYTDEGSLNWADEMKAEARTREIRISTFAYNKDDQELIVMTPQELDAELRACWDAARKLADPNATSIEWKHRYELFEDYEAEELNPPKMGELF